MRTPRRARALLFAAVVLAVVSQKTPAQMLKLPMSEADAYLAVNGDPKTGRKGQCGSLPLGTGLKAGRGWLHQPIPGDVRVCMSGGGTIETPGQPAAACVVLDMRPGRPNAITIRPTSVNDRMTWQVPGYLPGEPPIGFQLPPTIPGAQ